MASSTFVWSAKMCSRSGLSLFGLLISGLWSGLLLPDRLSLVYVCLLRCGLYFGLSLSGLI